MASKPLPAGDPTEDEDRRQFLLRCGRFAAVTPPAMTLLLAVAATPSEARASTIGCDPGYTVEPGKRKDKGH
jgi:hypothetical protein